MLFCNIAVIQLWIDPLPSLFKAPSTYTVREQEAENDDIDNSQMVVDKVGLVA